MRPFTTTIALIASKSTPSVNDIVESQGYTTKGDGRGAAWKCTIVGGETPSQSPAQLGEAAFTDASGNKWELIFSRHSYPESIGANADGATTDSTVVAAWVASCQSKGIPIRFNGAAYFLDSSQVLDGSVPVICEGSDATEFVTTDFSGSLFKYDIQTTRNGTTGFKGARFTFNYTGARSTSAAIEFSGASTAFLQYCNFDDLFFRGCESGTYNTHLTRTTGFGEENNVAWCNFTRIRSQGGTFTTKYVHNWTTGSGTGNSFEAGKLRVIGTDGQCFRFTGTGAVVGDILISGISSSADALDNAAFMHIGDNTVYRRNICFNCNQVDANILTPFDFSTTGSVEYQEIKWIGNLGGATALQSALNYTNGTILFDRNVSDVRVAREVSSLPSGNQQIDICKVDLKQNNACTVNFEVFALVQGVNSGMYSGKWHIRNSSGTASPTIEVEYNTPTTPIMTMGTSVTGSVVTFQLDITPTNAGSIVNAQAQGIGKNFRMERI